MRIIFKTDNHDTSGGKGRRQDTSRLFKFSLIIVILFAVLAILGSFLGDGGLALIYQQSSMKTDLKAKIAAEEEKKRGLIARVEALKNDPFELERVAREELGLVKGGEIVFDFREPGPR